MYESFFGLNRRPFCFAPAADRYFPVANSDAARQAHARCIDRAEGVGLLVAAAGLGKSLILQVLAEQFRDRFPVIQLGTGQIETRRELLQTLAHDLRIPFRGMDDGELRLAVASHLNSDDRCPQGILILADEAHTFSFAILDELRMLTNVIRNGEPRVRLLLAGNLRLEEALTDPRLESLSQRIVCRRYLERFDSQETAEYIRFQVAAAGGQVERVFEPSALDAVFQASDGIPRLINQLCDYALLTAYSDDQQPITAEGIGAAWAELQQLPGQWMDPQGPPQLRVSNGEDVIEYGGLSDDDQFDPVPESDQADAPNLQMVTDDKQPDQGSITGAQLNQSDNVRGDVTEVVEESVVSEFKPDNAEVSNQERTSSADESGNTDLQAEQIVEFPTDRRTEQEFEQIENQLNTVIQHVNRVRVTPDEEETYQPPVETDSPAVGNTADPKQDSSPGNIVSNAAEPEESNIPSAQPAVAKVNADDFEDEELVIDRYAQLESDARKMAPPLARIVVRPEPAEANTPTQRPNEEHGDLPAIADGTDAVTDDERSSNPETVSPTPEVEAAINVVAEQLTNTPPTNIQIEEDEDRLQVYVDPYGGLFEEELEDDAVGDDSGIEQPSVDTSATTAQVVPSPEDETIKLPPMAQPSNERANLPSDSTPGSEQPQEILRPFAHESTPTIEPEEANRPILIIEDDDDGDAEIEVTDTDQSGESPAHDVRLEDYETLFARLRGAQQDLQS
ncbi:MAG: AAA family ATPase [Pirellulales bacterium]|nr:AAA family ATPase [Pirellulales bacterium]